MGAGRWRRVRLPLPALHTAVTARVWSPDQDTDRLLLAHDGPEYQRRGGLAEHATGAGCHLVLLPPGERDEWYSACDPYAESLALDVLPRLRSRLGVHRVVGAGVSLGALAMLHAQRCHPAGFAGLFLQSGSFFQPRHDRQESGFRRWSRIVRYVRRVLTTGRGPAVPTTMTCGAAEENLANNRDMAVALRRQGYPVRLAVGPGGHDWPAWRAALDPHLTTLLGDAWPELR
ncbi:alpha/beta hydrolase [Actinoplanes awajinensis]|uniref:Enterochelin esterase n=1 Tax=Actinoplanes awajinensis subsp. mycoplanecinus TaxID=135947 RepID=A0A101JJ70_9ACTN|nr:alpha/beta hydrolase-fold protein [Actinoplanes awajinensis]KUL27411.1 enterochelin esterase [Actinoplanes awajinensis subsp. mycoplanecinus]